MLLSIFIRTVIIYVILTIIMRIMGKRQLGELDVGELVITILLSEIASLPITNEEKPIMQAIIPIVTLATLEILTSTLLLKIPFTKKFLSSKPSVIIACGVIDRRAMKKVRISLEELISQIRQNGIYDLDEVDYAILEENGKMSIIPKSRYRQPDRTDLHLPDDDSGVMHLIVSDGVINTHSLRILGKDEAWVYGTLKSHGSSLRDVFCMTCNDAGKLYIAKGDGTILSPSDK
ncbi:MAG: DUF421 domain-containing protein [Clostridia bacterium]|nr:DUF421 domain-containing protein [Clostridia bacterium]